MKAGLLKKFTVFDLVLLTMMAVLGVAIKPFIVPLAQIITGPLYIPGGVVAGGFYMLWIVLGCGLVDKRGAGTLIGIIQAILVIALGIYGSHGVASILTYIAPGIFVDLLYIILRGGVRTSMHALLGGGSGQCNRHGPGIFCIFPLAPYPSAVKSRGGFFVRSDGGPDCLCPA